MEPFDKCYQFQNKTKPLRKMFKKIIRQPLILMFHFRRSANYKKTLQLHVN